MTNPQTIAALNRLLDAETSSLAWRLGDAKPFVQASTAANWALVQEMIASGEARQRRLAELVVAADGVPSPPRRSVETAALHYLDLAFLMPSLLADQKRLVAAYESVGATGWAPADAAIAAGLAEQRRHLERLQALEAAAD